MIMITDCKSSADVIHTNPYDLSSERWCMRRRERRSSCSSWRTRWRRSSSDGRTSEIIIPLYVATPRGVCMPSKESSTSVLSKPLQIRSPNVGLSSAMSLRQTGAEICQSLIMFMIQPTSYDVRKIWTCKTLLYGFTHIEDGFIYCLTFGENFYMLSPRNTGECSWNFCNDPLQF